MTKKSAWARAWQWAVLVAVLIASNPATAQTSNCGTPDPRNFDQVYACMSSAHYGSGDNGQNFFAAGLLNTSCQSIAMKYAAVMRRAGAKQDEAVELVPSCPMFARVAEAMAGKPPYWASCTDYPGHFDPAHMKACLTRYLPDYRRSSLDRIQGCAGAVAEYEHALRSATIIKGRTITEGLPTGYARPDCQAVAAVIGNKGAECSAYAPTLDHARQCVGATGTRISDCLGLRQTYETKLREAYGGVLPPGYAPLTCQQLDPLLAEIKRRQEQQRPRPIGQPRPGFNGPIEWGHFGGLGDWLKLGMLGLGGGWASWAVAALGLPFLLAFILHGVLEAWSIIRSKAKPPDPKAGNGGVIGFILRTFGIGPFLKHGTLFSGGTWLFGLLWVPGALVAIVLGRLIAFALWSRSAWKSRRSIE
ncbi:hypothetical protein CBA19CS22_39580 [Caballeronia novacaledonica]|uniref:Uncharacterized protein n=1 Tax=Caballeronia novacaledonica TaxID=1544861 RepID=A0ACB5R6N3_9BURK|nr:hypothetical protein CBA19CS22_39580 [Caballeronia novacaledonica]